MKKQIISLLLLTSLSQAEDFYLGYDFLKVNYDDSGVNKAFDPPQHLHGKQGTRSMSTLP